MGNALSTKVCKFDLNFILKNYLKETFWGKSWLIFDYNKMRLFLTISSIDVARKMLILKIKPSMDGDEDAWWEYWSAEDFGIGLLSGCRNEKIVKNALVGACLKVIGNCERHEIANSKSCIEAGEMDEAFNNSLSCEANGILDDKGITDEDVRTRFIKSYVSENTSEKYAEAVFQSQDEALYASYYLAFLLYMEENERYEAFEKRLIGKTGEFAVPFALPEIGSEKDAGRMK
jgi:hypothetical protein